VLTFEKKSSAHALGTSVELHLSLLLMNSFKTRGCNFSIQAMLSDDFPFHQVCLVVSLYMLVTRRYRFAKISILSVLHDQTSVECL